MSLVVGDGKRRSVEVGAFKPDHRDLSVAEFFSGLESRVACNDLAGGLGHNGLLPAEAPDRRGYVRDAGIVDPGISRVADSRSMGTHSIDKANADMVQLHKCR